MQTAGILPDIQHTYSAAQDVFYRLAYTPACIKFKTIAPFFEICSTTGKTVTATEPKLFHPFTDKVERLRMARAHFETQATRLQEAQSEYTKAMVVFRKEQREWEVYLIELSEDKKAIAKAHEGVKQQEELEQKGPRKTISGLISETTVDKLFMVPLFILTPIIGTINPIRRRLWIYFNSTSRNWQPHLRAPPQSRPNGAVTGSNRNLVL
jgi:hypothetical protein